MMLKVERDNVKCSKGEENLGCRWASPAILTHGDQTFYRSFEYDSDVYTLGNVHYVRHLDDPERMSFVEIYMLWELHNTMYMSARVYYFPEDTACNLEEQGQDEVVCVFGEVVLRAEEFVQHLKFTANESKDLPKLKILSFSAYCRCAAMRRRLGNRIDEYATHPSFIAMGGVHPRYRVLYCRDTVNDRELEAVWKMQHQYRVPTVEPGRPHRKRIKYTDKLARGVNECLQEDSSDSAASAEHALNSEDTFTSDLRRFLQQRGIRLNKVPSVGYRQVNMREIYECVVRHGGYAAVSANRLWRKVFLETGGQAQYTGATTSTRKLYERYLLPYELRSKEETDTDRQNSVSKSSEYAQGNVELDVENDVQTIRSEQIPQKAADKTQKQGVQRTTWVHSSLLSNITDIKLPMNFIASQATPQQLDDLIKQLSRQIASQEQCGTNLRQSEVTSLSHTAQSRDMTSSHTTQSRDMTSLSCNNSIAVPVAIMQANNNNVPPRDTTMYKCIQVTSSDVMNYFTPATTNSSSGATNLLPPQQLLDVKSPPHDMTSS